jgi:hypothetical protein
MEEALKKEIREAVEDAFSSSVKDGRYVDVSRVPLICQSIVQIHKDVSEIKDYGSRISNLELSRAKQEGSMATLAKLSVAAWTVVLAFTCWLATQVVYYGQEIKVLNSKLSAFEIEVVE